MTTFQPNPSSPSDRHAVHLNIAVRAAKVGLWEWDLVRDEIAFSAEWKRQLGYAPQELRNEISEWETRVHPDDLPRVQAQLKEYLANPWPDYETEFRMRHKDGTWRWILAQADVVRDDQGQPARMIGSHIDITVHKRTELELARANRTLRMLSDSNQSVIRAQNEQELLNEVCRIAVDVGGYRMAWVGFTDDGERKTIRAVAHRGPPAAYTTTGRLSWGDGENGESAAGRAIRSGRVCVVRDIVEDPGYAPWRESALRSGYRAVAAFPLLANGRPFGALCVYAAGTDAFDAREMEILEEMAGDVAYGATALRTRADRDRADAALRTQLMMVDAFFQQSVSSFVLLDRAYRFVRVNETFAKFYGLTPADFVGQPCYFIYGDAQAMPPEYQAMLDGVVRSKTPFHQFAAPYVAPAGLGREVTYWDSTLQPILDAAGDVAFLVFTAKDVTERVRVQESLQRVLRHARTLVMQAEVTAPEGWEKRDARWGAGNLIWNASFADEAAAQEVMPLAREPGESYYDAWRRAKHPDDWTPMGVTAATALFAEASTWEQEFRAVDKFGQLHWFDQIASIKPAGHGRWHVTTINRDVTERRQAEAAALVREQEFRTLAEHSPDFIARFDRECRYAYVNPKLAELLNRPLRELIGKRPSELYPGMPGPLQFETWTQRVLETGEPFQHEIVLQDLPVAEPPCHLMRMVAERDASGKIVSALCIGRDITALKETERQLRTLTEHSPDLIARFDREARFLFVNGVVEQLTGMPPKAYLGRRVGEVTAGRIYPAVPDELMNLRRAITNVFTTGSTMEMEVRLPLPGAERVLSVRLVPEPDSKGEVLTVLHVGRDITERCRAEDALRESQMRLELANRATHIGPWDWNLLTNETHFSSEWKRQLGYADHEISNSYTEWESRLHPDDRDRVLEKLRAYLAGEEPDYEVEFRLRHKDGSYRWIFTRAEMLRNAEGKPCRMIGCHVDITTRKQAQEESRQSQQAYASLVNSVDGIVWELDVPTFRFTFVSQQAERLLGYPVARWLEPDFWREHLHPDDREWATRFCRRAAEEKRDHEFRYRMIAADGRVLWLNDIVTVVVENDRPSKLRGIMVDISEAKAAEEALRWRTALFEAQMDAGLDGILVVDGAGRKILQNQRMGELWKIPPHIAADPDDRVQVAFVTERTKNPQQFSDKVAYLYAHPDEVSRDEIELVDGRVLDRYSAPVQDKTGKHYGRIWTFRDVTGTRQLEEQLRQSQKMEAVGRLAGGIAHDFNNLLTVIQMQASMLLDDAASPQIGSSVQQIMAAAQRAANLTRQLLTFSRRHTKEARNVDLSEVIGTMTKLVRRILGEDISLEARFAPSLPVIHADPGMMEQVLMNLLVNARDAMPEGGEIVLALESMQVDAAHVAANAAARPGRFIRLSVKDTGSGIPAENLERIFEPFFTTKEIGKGTGLGLATVFGIVQQHQGWIEVDSALGQGTTFHIYLPAVERPVDSAERHAAAEKTVGGSETILLVEDEPMVRALGLAALQRHGYRVIEAATGVEALQRWAEQAGRIDLLLTDLIMPGGLSGQKLAEELRTRQPGLKVIYTSGYNSEAAGRLSGFEVGRNFLPKPYPLADLLTVVRQRLDEH